MKILTICAAAGLTLASLSGTIAAAQGGPPPPPPPRHRPDGPPPPPPGPRFHGHRHHPHCRMVWRHHHRVRRCY